MIGNSEVLGLRERAQLYKLTMEISCQINTDQEDMISCIIRVGLSLTSLTLVCGLGKCTGCGQSS
jgi:hypothetical protein